MVTVPPGHKVVVVHPTPKAYLGRGESGVWIADLGMGSDFADVVSRVAQMSARTGEPPPEPFRVLFLTATHAWAT